MIQALVELTNEFFLSQKILKSTHQKGNTLDLIFTDNPYILHSYENTDSLYSDHSIIECATTYNVKYPDSDIPKECDQPKEANYDSLNFFNDCELGCSKPDIH